MGRAGQTSVATVRQEPLAHEREAFHRQHDETPGRQFEFNRLGGNNPQTQAGLNRKLYRLVAAEFASRPKGRLTLRERD